MTSYSRPKAVATLSRHLWRYLSPRAAVEQGGYPEAVGQYMLPEDFESVLRTAVAVSPEAERMLGAAGEILKRLPSIAARRRSELYGEVRGPVDWYRTEQRRHETSDETLFVCSPAERRFESTHGRLLRTALATCESLSRSVPLAADQLHRAQAFLHHPKMAGVRILQAPAEAHFERVGDRFGMGPVIEYLRLVRDVIGSRNEDRMRQLLHDVVLRPATDDRLFELVVGFELVDRLVAGGATLVALQAIAGGRSPFAQLKVDNDPLLIWDQRAVSMLPSVPKGEPYYTAVRVANGLRRSSLRPDFVVQHVSSGRLLLIEVKLTVSDRYSPHSRGIADAMTYLMDRPDLFDPIVLPHVAVVAWGTDARPNPGVPIMVCSESSLDVLGDVVRGMWQPISLTVGSSPV